MTETQLVRVLVVDDHPVVRSGLASLLAAEPDIVVVGEAGNGDEALAMVGSTTPDVVLMDLRMRRVDGIRATAELHRSARPPVVLVLTTFETDADILGALRAGATGYLVKDTPPAEIESAIRRAAAGEPSLSPSVTRRLVAAATAADPEAGSAGGRAAARLAVLTDQERAVAAAVGRGWNNARIAAELYLSLSTVKTYISGGLAKLDLDNRTQLALLAHEAGLAGPLEG